MNIQQLRAQIAALQDATMDKNKNFCSSYDEGKFDALSAVDALLDSMQEEPISEPNKELAETYLDVFDKKFPILPTLKGKELADYKNFLNKCQQIFGLKHWGIYPTQAKLFEKISLLWVAWGAEHLHELGKYNKEEQDTTVSEDLEEAAVEAFKHIVDSDKNNFLEIFKAGAKWKEGQMMAKSIEAVVSQVPCSNEIILYNPSSVYEYSLPQEMNELGLNKGDEVKVIIIKSE